MAAPPFDFIWQPVVHHDCVCNQFISIRNRVLAQVPTPSESGLAALKRGARLVMRHLPHTEQQELDVFFKKYGGMKRQRYEDALEAVYNNGLCRRDAGVTMFVKCERISPLKNNPDPRAIQFRDPKYCVVLASYLKPMEDHLYALKVRHPLLGSTRLIGKGLNQGQRASLLVRKFERFGNPVAVSLDASRFDQHVHSTVLAIEHSVYQHCNPDPELARLLSWQLVNRVRTRSGYRYTCEGRRMSGDMNTALGNCVIMVSMVLAYMVPKKVQFDILDDGDDCLLILDKSSLSVIDDIIPFFLQFGQELKVEHIAYAMEHVNWCQSRPVNIDGSYMFVRDPVKVMSCSLISPKWRSMDPLGRRAYLAGIGECLLAQCEGVPVLQSYALALLRNAGDVAPTYDLSSGDYFRMKLESKCKKRSRLISFDTRVSFFLSFGWDVAYQESLEEQLGAWEFDVKGDVVCFGGWDKSTWTYVREPLSEFPGGK